MDAEVTDLLGQVSSRLGCFCSNGTWAIRTKPEHVAAIKQSLGQDATPSYLLRGVPLELYDDEVADLCDKLGWKAKPDPASRRIRNGRAQWVVRSTTQPPVSSTYAFSGSQRYRVEIMPLPKEPERSPRLWAPRLPPPGDPRRRCLLLSLRMEISKLGSRKRKTNFRKSKLCCNSCCKPNPLVRLPDPTEREFREDPSPRLTTLK